MASESSNDSLNHNYHSPSSNLKSKEQDRQYSQDMFEDPPNEESEDREHCDRPEKLEKKLNFQSVPNPPAVAVKEKIVFCIDNSLDKSSGYSFTNAVPNKEDCDTYSIRNAALKTFVINKLTIAKDTEFGITVLEGNNVKWLLPLTSDVDKVTESLVDLKPVNAEIINCDITHIFSHVLSKIEVMDHQTNKVKIIPPPYVIRIILVYGNSFVLPKVNTSDDSYIKFMMSPYCILDVMYLHEKQSEFNVVQQIYNRFEQIVSPKSYVMESSRNVTKVFNNMAKLLAHPFQRVPQTDFSF